MSLLNKVFLNIKDHLIPNILTRVSFDQIDQKI